MKLDTGAVIVHGNRTRNKIIEGKEIAMDRKQTIEGMETILDNNHNTEDRETITDRNQIEWIVILLVIMEGKTLVTMDKTMLELQKTTFSCLRARKNSNIKQKGPKQCGDGPC